MVISSGGVPVGLARHAALIQLLFRAREAWKGGGASSALVQAALGHLKGPLLKIGQWAAVVPGLLPEKWGATLQNLHNHAPALPWPLLRRRLEGEWGSGWRHHFSSFSPRATYGASLGQVHRARLSTGETVACKIQYPAIDGAVAQDLQLLRWLARGYKGWTKALDLSLLLGEWEQMLKQELDFHREAAALRRFGALFSQNPGITIPTPVDALCTEKILTMSWHQGRPMQEALSQPSALRDEVGALVLEAWYAPLYQACMLHGDPHWGNLSWTPQGIIMMDFGYVRTFSSAFVQHLVDLFHAVDGHHTSRAVEIYASWGLQDASQAVLQALHQWVCLLYRPFLLPGRRPFGQEVSMQEATRTLGDLYKQVILQRGKVRLPAELWVLDRVAVATGSTLLRLGAQQDWASLFRALQARYTGTACLSNGHQRPPHG